MKRLLLLSFLLSLAGCSKTSNLPKSAARVPSLLIQSIQTSGDVCSLAFSPDERELMAIIDHHVKKWDTQTWTLKSTSVGEITNCNRSKFSPDLKKVATVGFERFEPGNFTIWNVANSRILMELTAHQDAGAFIEPVFSPDGKLIAGGSENSVVIVWNVHEKKMLWSKSSDGISAFPSIAFTRDDSRIVIGGRNAILIREVKTGEVIRKISIGENAAVPHLDISPDASTIAINSGIYNKKDVCEQYIYLINSHSGRLMKKIRVEDSSIKFLFFSPDGKSVIVGDEMNVAKVWNIENGSLEYQLIGNGKELQKMAISPDGKMTTCAYDGGEIRIWRLKNRG